LGGSDRDASGNLTQQMQETLTFAPQLSSNVTQRQDAELRWNVRSQHDERLLPRVVPRPFDAEQDDE
jgi:hypothetical protein